MGAVTLTACNAVEVAGSPELDTDFSPPTDSDGQADGESGGGGEAQRVCAVSNTDSVSGETFRWHCSGIARSNIVVDLDVPAIEIPAGVEVYLDAIQDQGLDFQHDFGPGYGDDFDDGAVIACCEDDYGYPGTPTPDSENAEHGWACGTDCIDQACREIPRELRDMSDEIGLGALPPLCLVPLSGVPCFREQLRNLANYVASNHAGCVDAFNNQKTPLLGFQVYSAGGELNLSDWIAENDPNPSEAEGWPNLNNLIVDADCSISGPDNEGWVLPEEPESCESSNDNNQEDPFESGLGGGFWGADSFAAASGRAALSGPTVMGVAVSGEAQLEGGARTDCDVERCTQMSLAVRSDMVSLRDFTLVAPRSLAFSEGGQTLTVDDFRLSNQNPIEVPLAEPLSGANSSQRTVREFSFPAGSIGAVASGKLYGVPVSVALSNSTSLDGVLIESARGARDVELASADFEFVDAVGQTWTLSASFDGWVTHRRAPKADFEVRRVGDYAYLDGTLSSDGDGDPLDFQWWVGGVAAGARSRLRIPWDENAGKLVTLEVRDPSGRKTWHSGVVYEEPI
ncbi:MAG: hypothetical protein AAGA54_25090 [Myxococcota bacterium]